MGSIKGGDAFNVIPSEVELKGTLRSFEPGVRDLMIKRFHEIIENISQAMGCVSTIEVKSITPAVYNDPEVTGRVQQVARDMLSADTLDSEETTMGAEDMAYILNLVPGCYFFIGSANKDKNLSAPHHNSRFDFDESILPKAAGLMAASAMELLGK